MNDKNEFKVFLKSCFDKNIGIESSVDDVKEILSEARHLTAIFDRGRAIRYIASKIEVSFDLVESLYW